MAAYYNENDKQAAQWLRNLIAAGLIAPGDVDDRSIVDVHPDDLRGYTQCHFFAGIGIWSLALRRAGWDDSWPAWTGSCPCQPFSPAGKGEGFADERHLWPFWFHLIQQRRPPKLFGEQSAKAAEWLDLVRRDLEGLGYAVGAAPIEAASAGAFHLRDRFWLVADSGSEGLPERIGDTRILQPLARAPEGQDPADAAGSGLSWFNGPDGKRRPFEPGVPPLADADSGRVVQLRAYGNAIDVEVAAQFIAAFLDTQRDGLARRADLIDLDSLI